MPSSTHSTSSSVTYHLLTDYMSFRATSPQVSFFRSNAIFYRPKPSKHAISCRDDEMIMKHHESDIWQMDCIHLYHCRVPVLLSFDKTWNTSSAQIFRDKCFGSAAEKCLWILSLSNQKFMSSLWFHSRLVTKSYLETKYLLISAWC